MNYSIAVFSIELFTPTAKFIKRDSSGLNNVIFFAHSKKIPSKDFKDIEIFTPNFNVFERCISFVCRKLDIRYYFMSSRMKRYYLKEFQKQKIEVVIAHFGPSGIDILEVCRELNIPLVTIFHGYDISKLIKKKSYLNGLRKLNEYHAMKARAVSNFFVPELKKYIDAPKIFKLENGVEVSNNFNYISLEDDVYIIQAANLVEKKGVEYSIKSVIELIDSNPRRNIYFDICGDGPLRSELEKLVVEKYKKFIQFHGHLAGDEFKQFISRSNIFLHPSIKDSKGETETIPTAILEAMALGKIVVSTFHAGIPEVISNGYNGFMVEEKNIDELVRVLSDIINNGDDFKNISLNAHKTIFENFNSEKQYQKFKDVINSLVYEK
jgi:colanic acid/amylovoran biosynthesis glycosyltransferase